MKVNSFAATSALAAVMAFSQGAYAQSAASDAPASGGFGGFLGKLKEIGGTVVENMGKRVDINITPTGVSTNVQDSESNSSLGLKGANPNLGEVYRTIDGSPSKLKSIFNESNKDEASIFTKDTGWPRVAISFDRWGPKLKCWQGHVDIWTSAKNSTTEEFEACNIKYPFFDDMGVAVQPSDEGYISAMSTLTSYSPHPKAVNTGETRTAGPNPPLRPLSVRIATNGPNSDILAPFHTILTNIVVYSGFIDRSVFSMTGTFGKNKLDGRIWFYKFNLQGRVG